MKRIMVGQGTGLAILFLVSCQVTRVSAEEPHLVVNRLTIPAATDIAWHDSLESGWRVSRESGLPMVIFITSEHCTYCDAMQSSTWCESSVRERIGAGFIAIRLRQGHNDKTLGRIRIPMYPTTLIGTPEGKVIGHRSGFQPPGGLHQLLSEAGRWMTRRDAGLRR